MHLTKILTSEPVEDVEEEAFVVFSQDIPSQSLGFIDSQAATLDLTVAGYDLTINQSRGLLTSDRKQGTTGAVVWKITPLLATWLCSPTNIFVTTSLLTSTSTIIELGTGVSGILALALAPRTAHYTATDQSYTLKLLRENILQNLPTVFPPQSHGKKSKASNSSSIANKSTRTAKGRGKEHSNSNSNNATTHETSTSHDPSSTTLGPNISVSPLDWELDSTSHLPSYDMLIASDCIYNESLIEPLNTTCAAICRLRAAERATDTCRSSKSNPTLCLIAQQLRSPDVFEAWLKSFARLFVVWRVPDGVLDPGLREGSGFVVYVGILREDAGWEGG